MGIKVVPGHRTRCPQPGRSEAHLGSPAPMAEGTGPSRGSLELDVGLDSPREGGWAHAPRRWTARGTCRSGGCAEGFRPRRSRTIPKERDTCRHGQPLRRSIVWTACDWKEGRRSEPTVGLRLGTLSLEGRRSKPTVGLPRLSTCASPLLPSRAISLARDGHARRRSTGGRGVQARRRTRFLCGCW